MAKLLRLTEPRFGAVEMKLVLTPALTLALSPRRGNYRSQPLVCG